ncbi:hypothetical protein [Haladaptatus sp. DYF46]|uniref:DUF7287 family protein n=1 Tax=Haladaptatus sp. DYF46 TaxID=2886041 RepID=UPI001E4A80B0|nr:hypothetical protein [Haladaptatus sp. DYF46]
MGDRGQTLNDYVLGISVFLLTVAFVVAFLPSIFTPFNAPIDDSTAARASRGATFIIDDLSVEGRANVLDQSRTTTFFEQNETELRRVLGFPRTTDVNVTLVDAETGIVNRSAGDAPGDDPTAATDRIVRIGSNTYQLTVRVW